MKRKSGGKDFCGFALPGLFCFAAVVIIPFIYGIYLTLTDWNGVSDTKNFIGGANFLSVLKDSQFWSSLLLTFKYVVVVVVVVNILAFAIAYLLNTPMCFFERRVFKRYKHRRGLSILTVYLLALAIVVILLMIAVSRFIGGNSGKYFIRQQLDLANITGFVEERMNGQRVVKVFNHEKKSEEEFDVLNEKLFESASNAHTFASIMGPVIGNIGNLQFVLTAVLGGFLSIMGIGNITLGVMASYLQFTKSFTQPFMQVAQQFNSIIMALAGAERIFKMMDEAPEVDEGYVTLVNARKKEDGTIEECKERTGMWAWKHPHQAEGTVTYTELKGDVRFFDMSFGYEPDHMVLHDLTLYAKPGQKLAFVGSTGAGKTTITNLINRFYDVQDGKIRYDGININKIKKADLRRSLGIVLQDTHLFTGTIMDNIRYGKLDATDEEVYNAAKLAHADQFIQMLPQGYNTMLTSDGEELSQGQRQLLAIARAAVADPPVLILDEATSSIDTRTESIVQKGMDNLMKGRTVFVIAHRLSTIRNSDAIMVLEHGRIIERGTHEDLLALKGTYYQLYTGKLELS